MSHAAADWVRSERTSKGPARLLLCELAHWVGNNGEGWAVRDRVLWGANMSLDQYKRATRQLRELGLLAVVPHGGGKHGKPQYRPPAYYFLPMMTPSRIAELGLLDEAPAPSSSGGDIAPSEVGASGGDIAPSGKVQWGRYRAGRGGDSAPSLYKEDPLDDPLLSPVVTNDGAGGPVDDDDGEAVAAVRAAAEKLAAWDLARREKAVGSVGSRAAWLRAALAERLEVDGDALVAAYYAGEHDPAALASAFVDQSLSVSAVAGAPAPSVPYAESKHPDIVKERRRLMAVPDELQAADGPALTHDEMRERIRQTRRELGRR